VLRKKCQEGVQLLHDSKLVLTMLDDGCMHQIQVIEDKFKGAEVTQQVKTIMMIFH